MKVKDIALDGVVKQNPIFRLVLGTCPALAITTTMFNAVGMGVAVVLVMVCSNTLISLLRKVISDKVRIPCYIMVIATFTTIVIMLTEKYIPDLYDSLGVFLSLVVFNCVIFARAETFASSNGPIQSAIDGFFNGLGYMGGLLIISFVREFLGFGALFGYKVMNFSIDFFAQPAGGFLTFGILIAVFNFLYAKAERKQREKQALPQTFNMAREGE